MPVLTPVRERWLLLALAGVQFTHILDFMVMMPLGPRLTRLFAITDAEFGLLVSAYTLAAGLSGLLATVYLDRHDRKHLLLGLYALFGLATLACGMASDYHWLLMARVAAGGFGGVLTALVQTIVADAIPFERRGRAMGVVMSAFSVSTVAGVPFSLWLATVGDWHWPFLGLALLCALIGLLAWRALPALDQHLQQGHGLSIWQGIRQVLADRNHLLAYAFTVLLMGTGFVVIPYITIYLQANVGLTDAQVPGMYLTGGLATLVTARWVGQLADRMGKVAVFRVMAVLVALPLLSLTRLSPGPLWLVYLVTTLLFVVMSGRMIPAMALITAAANPALRGTFMAFQAAVQSASMGLAAFVGGWLIARDAHGQVLHYEWSGVVGVLCSVLSFWLVGRLQFHTSAQPHRR